MQAILGITILIGFCWLLSEQKKQVRLPLVAVGLLTQFLLAILFLQVEWASQALLALNSGVYAIEQATLHGTIFLFGFLGGGDTPYEITQNQATYLFAFRVLPQVVVFSVVVALLWYLKVLQLFVRGFGWLLKKFLSVNGVVGTAGAASLFLGMVETPLVIRAYLAKLSRADLFTVMTFGMSTVAGSVMVLYAGILNNVMDGVIGHIIAASAINIFGAIYISHLMIPATDHDDTPLDKLESQLKYDSLMDAITRGTTDGLQLALNVGGMLLVLISLVALLNGLIGFIDVWQWGLSLQTMLGWAFAPVAWLIGIDWADAQLAGSFLGTKLVLNELVAYLAFADHLEQLSAHSKLVLIYALCGFANFGSLGILLGGLSALIPERRAEYLKLAPRSIISGTVVTLVTGAIVSLVAQI